MEGSHCKRKGTIFLSDLVYLYQDHFSLGQKNPEKIFCLSLTTFLDRVGQLDTFWIRTSKQSVVLGIFCLPLFMEHPEIVFLLGFAIAFH